MEMMEVDEDGYHTILLKKSCCWNLWKISTISESRTLLEETDAKFSLSYVVMEIWWRRNKDLAQRFCPESAWYENSFPNDVVWTQENHSFTWKSGRILMKREKMDFYNSFLFYVTVSFQIWEDWRVIEFMDLQVLQLNYTPQVWGKIKIHSSKDVKNYSNSSHNSQKSRIVATDRIIRGSTNGKSQIVRITIYLLLMSSVMPP